MSQEFYDPVLIVAGRIAEEYAISISDVIGLLLRAGRDEALVRQVLATAIASHSSEVGERLEPHFDLVAGARLLLEQAIAEGHAKE